MLTRGTLAGLLLAFSLFSGPALAQDWSFISPLTAQVLDVRPGDSAPILFSDNPDPGVAETALVFHYFDNRGGGNALMLNVGLFKRKPDGWHFIGPVEVFGSNPREANFYPGQVRLKTTMPGPNDPRCCPTLTVDWVVDTDTLQVWRLN